MSSATSDDELLIILLRNLRNVSATLGESSSSYASIRKMVQDHLQDMKRKGLTTNLTQARQDAEYQMQGVETTSSQKGVATESPKDMSELIETLAKVQLEPKEEDSYMK